MKALFLCERIRIAIEATRFDKVAQDWTITASFGLAEQRREEALTNLFERADGLLYIAKRGGRNRIVTDATAVAIGSPFDRREPGNPESMHYDRTK